eukprot:3854873-Prymnesium_polylepis.1
MKYSPSTTASSSPRNSMDVAGPRCLCGAHSMPRASSSSSSMLHPSMVSSSVSPTTRKSSTKT